MMHKRTHPFRRSSGRDNERESHHSLIPSTGGWVGVGGAAGGEGPSVGSVALVERKGGTLLWMGCGGGVCVRTCFGVGTASCDITVMGQLTRALDLGRAPGMLVPAAFGSGVGVARWNPLTTVMGRRVSAGTATDLEVGGPWLGIDSHISNKTRLTPNAVN